jgi:polyisoprenoid-binding protein YceI
MQVTEELVPAGVWAIDPTHSSVRFEVEHMGISPFSARFTDVDAALDRRDGEIELHGRVRVASVDVEDEILLAHLMAPDFFDNERYPEIGFRSTAISGSRDDVIVAGELTIKGTTRTTEARGAMTESIADPQGGERIGLTLATTIDRTDYGLTFQLEMPSGSPALGNQVELIVSLELVKEA